jgi:hypothetical protein
MEVALTSETNKLNTVHSESAIVCSKNHSISLTTCEIRHMLFSIV